MVETVYVLGYSGSGKTTAVRCIEMLTRDMGEAWSTSRFNDYQIMYDWFINDSEQQWFRPTEYKGFDILIPEVYDKVMEELIRKICEYKPSERELMMIDFARCDYSSSLALLGRELLQHAYFLFLNAELETCVQRIQRRVLNPQTIDDHFVPESVFECFRQRDDQYITSTIATLKTKYRISEKKIIVIDNKAENSLQNLNEKLWDFVNSIKLKHTEGKIHAH
jgi:thymidylate kinase